MITRRRLSERLRSHLTVWAQALLCALLLVHARPVRADDQSDLARAEASFRAGAAAYAAGDYPAAIQALDAAYALTPLPAIAFSLAQAERRQYFVSHERPHLERAIALFRGYVEQVQAGGRRADALDALGQLEPLLATLPGGDPASIPGGTGVQRTRVMITSEAPGARISLDGGEELPSPLIREVSPGVHRVRARAEGFHEVSRDITALQGELILTELLLPEQPSKLLVSTPDDAELFMDGRFAHQGGAQVALELPGGTHQLAVAARGRRVAYRTLTLARGKTERIRVTLEPTPQRIAARTLFIAGGLGLGMGLTMGVFALRDQGDAENFLAKQKKGNVTQAELRRYHDSALHRDRNRLGATITLGASAAMFVTGLFLHQLDRPDEQDIQRKSLADRRGERRTSQVTAVRLAPELARDAWSLSLSGRF
jgi:hypothetical protein